MFEGLRDVRVSLKSLIAVGMIVGLAVRVVVLPRMHEDIFRTTEREKSRALDLLGGLRLSKCTWSSTVEVGALLLGD